MEGVYYVPRSLFTQDRNREGALSDILQRYAATPHQTMLISSSMPFLKAAARLGIRTHEIAVSGKKEHDLLAALKSLEKTSF